MIISIILSGLAIIPNRAGSIDGDPVIEQMSLSGFLEIEDVAERLTYQISPYGPTTWGDIDGNGFVDSVTGIVDYPRKEDPEKPGAILIQFDVSQDGKKCLFKGSDPRDRLGSWVEVSDINGDGFDDIFVGAYGADGVNDNKYHCGEIHIIYGKDNRSFPNSTDIENVSDIILEGNAPKRSGYEDYPGDMIGREFTILDMDGDGYKELIVANHVGWGVGTDGRIWRNRGWVSSYQLLNIMNAGKKNIVLKHPSDDWTVIGMDEGDNLGLTLRRFDVNHDGLLDLVISAPGGDGEGNMNPEIGEVFVIKGSRYRFLDLKTSGPAFDGKNLYCRSGTSIWNITFRDTSRKGGIEMVELGFHTGPDHLRLQIDPNGSRIMDGNRDDVMILGSVFQNDHNGISFCEIETYFNWSVPLKGPTNVKVSLLDGSGNSTYTLLRKRVTIFKDLTLKGKPTIMGGNMPIELTGGHILPKTPITISNIDVAYSDNIERNPDPGSVEIVMESEDGSRDSFLNGYGSDLIIEAGNDHMENITLILEIPDNLESGQIPPDMGQSILLNIPVDLEEPDTPTLVSFEMERKGTGESMYDLSIDWRNELGRSGDNNGSGVRQYEMEYGDHYLGPVMEKGGLMATCFNGDEYSNGILEYIEEDLAIDWGVWGPDPGKIYRNDFSVRWHGWLMQEEGGDIDLDLKGTGKVKLLIREETVMNWTSLSEHPSVKGIKVDDNEFLSMEIYYRYEGEDSHITMTMEDTTGDIVVPGPDILYHPSTSFNDTIEPEGSVSYGVYSVDWTGRISEPFSIEKDIDSTSPSIRMDDVPNWFNKEKVTIGCRISDRSMGETNSGLIDLESIEYMIQEEGTYQVDNWTRKGIRIDGDTDPLRVSVDVERKDGWRGIIQFRASDTGMNMGVSERTTIGFDLMSPKITIIDPASTATITEGPLTIRTRATDIGGSGVNPDSMLMRSRMNEGSWSDWLDMDTASGDGDVIGSIIISTVPSSLELQTLCLDLAGNTGQSDILRLEILKEAVNRPPVPVISGPRNGSYHEPGIPLILDATGTRDDGRGKYSELHLTWTSNISGYITSNAISEATLEKGLHRLTLHADDGTPGHNISTSVEVIVGVYGYGSDNIFPEPDPGDVEEGTDWMFFFLVIVGISFLLAILGILYMIMKKPDEPPEVNDD